MPLALGVGGLVALGLLEVGLRLRGGAGPRYAVWPPGLVAAFEPDPARMPGVAGPSTFRVGSLGLRGDEPAASDERRVLCLGGSTTECLYLDQDEAWPQLLQGELRERTGRRVWVGNAGKSGLTTREHVLQLRHLPDHLPALDDVVVLAGVNDLGARLALEDAYRPAGLDDAGVLAESLRRAFAVAPGRDADLPPWKRTALWRAARRLAWRAAASSAAQDRRGEVYDRWRAHRAAAGALRDELPDLGPALEEYRRNLRACAELARGRGLRLTLVTQPCLWRAGLEPELAALCWMGGVGAYQRVAGAEYYTPRALAEGLARFDAALLEVAAEEGLGAVDLAARVPRDAGAFYDDVHFNEAGARLVANALAEALAAPQAPVQSPR